MIPLPPGCSIGYEIRIIVNDLTDEMGEWFQLVGGQAWGEEEYDFKGRRRIVKNVRYGNAKSSYHMKNGTNQTLIRFSGTDASTASMFLIKFYDNVDAHNMENYLHD